MSSFWGKFLLGMFVLLQVLDGVFTYYGVSAFGIKSEGNLLIVTVMSLMGVVPGLVVAKLFAILCGIVVYKTNHYFMLTALTLLYLVFAVFWWAHIFLSQ